MATYEGIKKVLEGFDMSELVKVYNGICYDADKISDLIFPMTEFDDMVGMIDASEAIRRAYCGNFRCYDEWVFEDCHGWFISFTKLDDDTCPIEIENVAWHIFDCTTYPHDMTAEEMVAKFIADTND